MAGVTARQPAQHRHRWHTRFVHRYESSWRASTSPSPWPRRHRRRLGQRRAERLRARRARQHQHAPRRRDRADRRQLAPFFRLPTYLSADAVYDDTYTVRRASLSNTNMPGTSAGVMRRYGLTLAQRWIVTASAAYTSSYGVPAASTWTPISYNGLVYTNTTDNGPAPATTPDDILTAWTKVNGPLPSFGKIKFQVQPVDPVTGCPGPALSCTFEWQNGTLFAPLAHRHRRHRDGRTRPGMVGSKHLPRRHQRPTHGQPRHSARHPARPLRRPRLQRHSHVSPRRAKAPCPTGTAATPAPSRQESLSISAPPRSPTPHSIHTRAAARSPSPQTR